MTCHPRSTCGEPLSYKNHGLRLRLRLRFRSPFLFSPLTTRSYVYTQPASFKNVSLGFFPAASPVTVLAALSTLLKFVQAFFILSVMSFAVVEERVSDPAMLLPALALIGYGQYLNICVYSLLGEDLYYAHKLGKAVTWVTAFPYSRFRDPQYLGAILTLSGATLLGVPPLLVRTASTLHKQRCGKARLPAPS